MAKKVVGITFSAILRVMVKIKCIGYLLLWIFYSCFSFCYFQVYNTSAAIPSVFLAAIGAWFFGTHAGLLLILGSMIYHYFLLDYHAGILEFYQTKAIGTFSEATIAYFTGSIKKMQDEVRQLSVILDQRVTERTEELHRLIEQLISDEENVRRSLGQDIHDSLGQNLTGLLLYSSSLQSKVHQNHPTESDRIDKLVENAQKNLHLARKISRTLFPFKLMGVGLDAALDELTSYFMETHDIAFDLHLNIDEHELPNHMIIHFYRMIYECVLNALHCDKPSVFHIFLSRDTHNASLTMEIEGCDSPSEMLNHVFIELMHYRIQLIEGHLSAKVLGNKIIAIRGVVPLNELQTAPNHRAKTHV